MKLNRIFLGALCLLSLSACTTYDYEMPDLSEATAPYSSVLMVDGVEATDELKEYVSNQGNIYIPVCESIITCAGLSENGDTLSSSMIEDSVIYAIDDDIAAFAISVFHIARSSENPLKYEFYECKYPVAEINRFGSNEIHESLYGDKYMLHHISLLNTPSTIKKVEKSDFLEKRIHFKLIEDENIEDDANTLIEEMGCVLTSWRYVYTYLDKNGQEIETYYSGVWTNYKVSPSGAETLIITRRHEGRTLEEYTYGTILDLKYEPICLREVEGMEISLANVPREVITYPTYYSYSIDLAYSVKDMIREVVREKYPERYAQVYAYVATPVSGSDEMDVDRMNSLYYSSTTNAEYVIVQLAAYLDEQHVLTASYKYSREELMDHRIYIDADTPYELEWMVGD